MDYGIFDISNFDIKELISTGWKEYTYSEYGYGGEGDWLELNEDGTLYKQEPHEISKCDGNWNFNPETYKLSFSFECTESSLMDGSITTYSRNSEGTFILSSLTIEGSFVVYYMSNSPLSNAILENDLAPSFVRVCRPRWDLCPFLGDLGLFFGRFFGLCKGRSTCGQKTHGRHN